MSSSCWEASTSCRAGSPSWAGESPSQGALNLPLSSAFHANPPPLPVARRTPLLRRDQVLHFPALGLRSNFSLRRTALPSTPTSWNLLYATQMPPPSQGPASPPSWTELSFLSFLASLAKDLSLANTLCFRAGEPSDLTPKWFFTLSAFLARTPNVWPLSGTQLISTFSTRSSWCLWSIENSPRVSATCTLRCFH